MKAVATLLILALLLATASAAEPLPTPKPVYFATGSTRGTVGGRVTRGAFDLYSLTAAKGQILTVTFTVPDDNAVFQIYEPDLTIGRDADGAVEFKGTVLPSDDPTRWSGRLPQSGKYVILIGSTRGSARYSMDIKIE